jgi:hypothetical protein
VSHTGTAFVLRVSRCYSAQWGFHPGGWGKPPLDEYNRPLYGDVFGVLAKPEAEVGLRSIPTILVLTKVV